MSCPASSHQCGGMMQIFIKPRMGNLITLDVKHSDTVRALKVKIEDEASIPAIEQALIFAGKQLEDRRTLSFYNIRQWFCLTLMRWISIHIRTFAGNRITMDVEVGDTVDMIKAELQFDLVVLPDQYRLIYSGTVLEFGHTLSFYTIQSGDELHMVPSGMYIFVKSCSGKVLTLDVKDSDTIADVKVKILHMEPSLGIHMEQWRLTIFDELMDDKDTLSDYSIQAGETLIMAQP